MRRAAVAVTATFAALGLGACDLFPQNATEWTVAGVIFGVIVVGVVAISIYASKKHDKKPDR